MYGLVVGVAFLKCVECQEHIARPVRFVTAPR
jgi:hypothetical protein